MHSLAIVCFACTCVHLLCWCHSCCFANINVAVSACRDRGCDVRTHLCSSVRVFVGSCVRLQAISPVAGSPLLGFGKQPLVPMPIMEIHGSADDIIPANLSQSYQGEVGPNNSTVSSDGFYYEQVYLTMEQYTTYNGCRGEPEHYPTRFDGETDLYCVMPRGSACGTGNTVVRCSHSLGHTWPFGNGVANREKYALLVWEFFSSVSKAKEAPEAPALTQRSNSSSGGGGIAKNS